MENKDLTSLLGNFYRENDDQGAYLGCFEPVYFLYDFLPHYSLAEADNAFEYPYNVLLKYFSVIDKDQEAQYGDVVVFKIYEKVLHCGVYMNDDRIIHVRKGHFHQLHRLKSFRASLHSILRLKAQ